MALPEIPQARARMGFLREHKRKLAAAGLLFLGLLLFLSLVPLPEPHDQTPIAKVERAILNAVPRWRGANMERSDPLAMVSAPGADEASAGPAAATRVATAGYDVAKPKWDVPAPPEAPAYDSGGGNGEQRSGARLEPKGGSFGNSGSGSGGAGSSSQGGGASAKAELAANAGARPGAQSLLSRASGVVRKLFARRSGLTGGAPDASKSRGGVPIAAARTQEPGGSSEAPGGKAPPPLTPVAGVPDIGKAVVVGSGGSGSSGAGGGGGGGVSRGGVASTTRHRCSIAGTDKRSLTCYAAQCMLSDIRSAYEPLLAVSMAYHGAAPPGAPAGSGADLLGGMIDKGIEQAADFAGKADAIKARAAGYQFQCPRSDDCDDLSSCRDFVVDQLTRASSLMRDSARAFESARQPCKVFPGKDTEASSRCESGLAEASSKDRVAAEKVKQALVTAGGQSSRQCRTTVQAEQHRWDTFNNALIADLRPVLATIEKPYCPDRLPCEPRGVSMLREAYDKLADLGRSVDSLSGEVGGLPSGSGSAFASAAGDLNQAMPMIENAEDAQSQNLFRGIALIDRAVARAGQAADSWGALAGGSCAAQ